MDLDECAHILTVLYCNQGTGHLYYLKLSLVFCVFGGFKYLT